MVREVQGTSVHIDHLDIFFSWQIGTDFFTPFYHWIVFNFWCLFIFLLLSYVTKNSKKKKLSPKDGEPWEPIYCQFETLWLVRLTLKPTCMVDIARFSILMRSNCWCAYDFQMPNEVHQLSDDVKAYPLPNGVDQSSDDVVACTSCFCV